MKATTHNRRLGAVSKTIAAYCRQAACKHTVGDCMVEVWLDTSYKIEMGET
jgi:hypothetical protein